MSDLSQQYTGRLYTQPEVDRMLREARMDELERIEPKGGDRPLIWTTGDDLDLAITIDERIKELSKEDV